MKGPTSSGQRVARQPARAKASPLATALSAVFLLAIAGAPAPAPAQQNDPIDRIITNQIDLLRRYEPVPKQGSIDITVIDESQVIPEEEAKNVPVFLRTLRLRGAESVDVSVLEPAWTDSLGQEISLADLYAIARNIERRYQAAGVFVHAVVPVQDFSTGNIVIQLYESGLREVTVESDIPGIRQRLAPYIDRLLAVKPLRVAEVERALLLMSDLGGLTIEGTARRPVQPGEGGTLHLQVGYSPGESTLTLNNFGDDETGPVQAVGVLQLNDRLGLFESSTLVAATVPDAPKELTMLQLTQDYPLGTNGLHAGYNLNHVQSRPGEDLRDIDLNVQITWATAFVRYPLLRRIQHSVFAEAQLNYLDSSIDVLGDAFQRDRLRWLTGKLSYSRELENGSFELEGELNLGLNGLGANSGAGSLLNRPGMPSDYRIARLNLDANHGLWEGGGVSLKVQGQYSPDPLPQMLQIDFGGTPFGRAFEGSAASGDSGVQASIEVQQAFDTPWPAIQGASAFVFGDYGSYWNHNVSTDYTHATLGSYGLGVRFQIGGSTRVEVLLARPWKEDSTITDSGSRVLFQVGTRF